MEDEYNLQRFIDAQSLWYNKALNEINNGRKRSHWIWFIFPQILGLGRSTNSIKYALKSKEEAILYLNHPILGSNLIEITKTFLILENKSAYEILGSTDSKKLKSCMTLFDFIQSENNIFQDVILKYFNGNKCNDTLNLLKEQLHLD